MTAAPLAEPDRLAFALPPELSAGSPAETRARGRDDVRLLVSHRAPGSVTHRHGVPLAGSVTHRHGVPLAGSVTHHHFTELAGLLRPGDLLVANSSATFPAAVDLAGGGRRYAGVVAHFSTRLPDGDWVVELRARTADGATVRWAGGRAGDVVPVTGGGWLRLADPYSPGRLWRARLGLAGPQATHPHAAHPDATHPDPVLAYLGRYGRPIRYSYVDRDWPLPAYQTVFSREPGSAEMPSAGRPFTGATLARLAAAGVGVATVVLHTGVASLEADERPYPERFVVPAAAARAVRHARGRGGRVVAIGTTVVRALESAVDAAGDVRAASGWTDLVVTPDRPLRAVDGLLTGFHEPAASHLLMLEAVAGPDLLARTYAAALERRYLWHEFGDVNLLI